jgi:hypothetical protein
VRFAHQKGQKEEMIMRRLELILAAFLAIALCGCTLNFNFYLPPTKADKDTLWVEQADPGTAEKDADDGEQQGQSDGSWLFPGDDH